MSVSKDLYQRTHEICGSWGEGGKERKKVGSNWPLSECHCLQWDSCIAAMCVSDGKELCALTKTKTKSSSPHYLWVPAAFVGAVTRWHFLLFYIYLSSQPPLPPPEVCLCSQSRVAHQMPSGNRDRCRLWNLAFAVFNQRGVRLGSEKYLTLPGRPSAQQRGFWRKLVVSHWSVIQ